MKAFLPRATGALSVLGLAAASLALGIAPLAAQAQDYPNRAIRLVVPFAPGGTTDVVGRVFAQALQDRLAQPVVVENRPGAGSQIGTDSVARSVADGYTLLLGPADGLAILPALKKTLPYDPNRDFTPISMIAHSPMVFTVHGKFPVNSLGELIAHAKAKPGEIKFGSAGTGSILQLAVELLRSRTGTDMVHVPYKGGGPALVGLVQGDVQLMAAGPATGRKQSEAGLIRALAQTGRTRHGLLPNVPTTAELGMPDIEVVSWFSLMGPPGLPAPIVNRLAGEVTAIAAQPAFRSRLVEIGCEASPMDPATLSRYIADEIRKWVKVVQDAKIPLQD